MDGQGILGRECSWCGKPATAEVLVRLASVPACDDHRAIMERQPEKPQKARTAPQMGLFDGTAAPGDAITGG